MTKRRTRTHHARVICADPHLLADPPADLEESVTAPLREARASEAEHCESPGTAGLSAADASSGLGAGERKGRGGRSAVLRRRRPRLARRASSAAIRPPPARCAPAWRFRAPPPPPKSCASTPTQARCATCVSPPAKPLGPAARPPVGCGAMLASRPPSLDPGRIVAAAARLDLAVDPNGLASSLKACAGQGDPVSAAAKSAALAFSAFPDAPAADAEILALWAFDLVLALRLRWPRPLPLIATKILDPGLRSHGGGRPRPGEPAWPNAAAGAIALAAASALDLTADLSRRADTLIAVAPKLRAKPAQKIVDLLLAQDCVSPAEAARHAPMTGRAARRLFDRLVRSAPRANFPGRPTFRLYGL